MVIRSHGEEVTEVKRGPCTRLPTSRTDLAWMAQASPNLKRPDSREPGTELPTALSWLDLEDAVSTESGRGKKGVSVGKRRQRWPRCGKQRRSARPRWRGLGGEHAGLSL